MSDKEMKCCFIGHRTVQNKPLTTARLYNELRVLMERYPSLRTFLFGSRSDFNDLCHQVVTVLRETYPDIKRIMYTCRSEAACMESDREATSAIFSQISNRQVEFQGYEGEHKFADYFTAGRASYVERNKVMIDDSDICIFYAKDDYIPNVGGNSGTLIAYEYAEKVSKKGNGKPQIINIYSATDNE